jgi:hypothetical protein
MTEIDARRLIAGDLQVQRKERAIHFRVALALAVAIPAALIAVTGLRHDLLGQPTWLIAAQLLVWGLALGALPAIGLGLWFPGRVARVVLGAVAATAAVLVAAGPELVGPSELAGPAGRGLHFDYCTRLTLGSGALVLAVCALSGAFAIRRRPEASLWISAAVVLIAVNTTAWHCYLTGLDHTLPSHLGSGVLLLLLAGLLGVYLHRRQRP